MSETKGAGLLLRCARGAAVAAAMVWLAGRLLNDRFHWSQFLWWVPWPVLAVVALPAAFAAIAARPGEGRGRRFAWCLPLVVIVAASIGRDVGLGVGNGGGGPTLRLVQWNASWPGSLGGAEPAARLLGLDADLVVVTNPYKLLADGRSEAWRDAGYDVVQLGLFLVASRLPLLDARLVSVDAGRVVAVVRVAWDGATTTMVPIDIPSNPWLARNELLPATWGLLPESVRSEAAIVLGDLNTPRGSASIARTWPRLHEAWDEAGVGFGGSWPRSIPMIQIDHVLLGAELQATSCRFIDLGSRSHRAQEVVLVRRRGAGPG